jgi:hypothetical protein
MKELLAYLFEGSQIEAEVEETRAAIEKILEQAEKEPTLKSKRAPLVTALKAIGLEDVGEEIEYDPEGFSLMCQEEPEYRRYVRLLLEPDNMEKMAKLGWVVTRCGDVAMSNELPEFRIRFFEVGGTEPSHDEGSWPAPNPELMKRIIKAGREFASTPMDRDSEVPENPVKNPDTAPDKKHAGMSDAADGKDPEGKPKGSARNEAQAVVDWLLNVNEGGHKPGCPCGFCKNKGKFGRKDKDKEEEKPVTEARKCRIRGCQGQAVRQGLCQEHLERQQEREAQTGRHHHALQQIWKGHEAGRRAWARDVGRMDRSATESRDPDVARELRRRRK